MDRHGSYASFDGMTWPVPGRELDELGWRLRYGELSSSDKVVAAAVIDAYRTLVYATQAKRNHVSSRLRAATVTKSGPRCAWCGVRLPAEHNGQRCLDLDGCAERRANPRPQP